jgi:dTDP-4-dehydrorhamnose reductase
MSMTIVLPPHDHAAPPKIILIFGASGMLGHMLIRVLSPHHHVIGTTTSQYNSQSPLVRILTKDNLLNLVDARSLPTVEKVIHESKPDVIINCVGLIKQKIEADSSVDAIYLNSLFPHQLAEICQKSDIRLIHFGTDCVFQGTPGVKRLSDTPNATDLYGLSKLLGEVNTSSCLTLRTSIVGRQLFGSDSLFEWARSQRGKVVHGYKNAIYSGLTTLQLSQIIKKLIEDFPELSGTHQVASSPISKFELISKLNNYLKLNLCIEPETEFYCDRTLDGSEFSKLTNIDIPSWDDMFTAFAADQSFYDSV